MRIAHLTDIHIDSSEISESGFISCLKKVDALLPKPDLILFGGDLVRDALIDSKELVEQHWERFQTILKEHCSIPYVHCVGNHDVCGFESVETAKQLAFKKMGLGRPYYAFSSGGWRFLVLDSTQPKADHTWYEAKLDEQQFLWLKTQLENFQQEPTLILSHIPILSAAAFLDGENAKEGNWTVPGAWMHLDAKRLVELFSAYPQIKTCVSGHLHLHDTVVYNGITFACNGAVSGNWWKGNYQQTAPGFAVMDLLPDGNFNLDYQTY